MREITAIIESAHESEIREINSLESRIIGHEDEADGRLWEQAAMVVDLLRNGMTQRALAAQWKNARTGEAYSHMHVGYTAQVFGKHAFQDPRPRFREAYMRIAHASSQEETRKQRRQELARVSGAYPIIY